jgi:hypothetical protein
MSRQLRRLQERGETALSDGVPLGLATGPSRYDRVYHARVPYRHRVPWSGFNDLRKEVRGSRRPANEVKLGSDRSTTVSCGGGRGGQWIFNEENGGSKRWSEPSGRQESRRVDPQLCFNR